MVIYRPMTAHNYEWVICCKSDDYDIFHTFDGSSRSGTWRPISVRRCPADERQKGLPSDFPWLSSDVLVMRKRAIMALRDLLDAHGELLPLATDDDVELFAFNARVVDALDESKADIVRAPDTGEIMFIEQVAFTESKIQELDIFRLPYRANPTYISQRFIDRVRSAELVGLEFDVVWSTE